MRSSPWFTGIVAAFVTTLIVSNIVAVKLADFGGLVLPAAVVIFPVSYLFGDVLTEVYGYAQARRVIWLGFGCNLMAVIAIWVSQNLPPAAFWAPNQPAFEAILGFTPRLLLASLAAYLVGEFANAAVLSRMKLLTKGRFLWTRTIGSTLIGQGLDSAVFITVAFYGVIPLAILPVTIVTQWLFKTAYEVAATPLTYLIVNWLKRVEGMDVFDRETPLNPFKIAES
ncbi:MAG TPA: queuosine precursor transporter [Chloroflexota bacterium]|nr:queuosine precursor transporter [Chloroflexota bacterium]HEX2988744.1 queuosine precursor transporter [Chloroflexota bacterium]